jgi:hypothetical protein
MDDTAHGFYLRGWYGLLPPKGTPSNRMVGPRTAVRRFGRFGVYPQWLDQAPLASTTGREPVAIFGCFLAVLSGEA